MTTRRSTLARSGPQAKVGLLHANWRFAESPSRSSALDVRTRAGDSARQVQAGVECIVKPFPRWLPPALLLLAALLAIWTCFLYFFKPKYDPTLSGHGNIEVATAVCY